MLVGWGHAVPEKDGLIPMLGATTLGTTVLDLPTLFFVAVCIAGLLGLFLTFAWMQERDTRALAWWGSAYLLGASSLAFWNTPAPLLPVPLYASGAFMFMACGMIWNGVRLFHGRRTLLLPTFAGAGAWLVLSQLPGFDNETAYATAGAVIIALYTFSIAFELWRERRRSLRSRFAGIAVPLLHEAIFLMPIAMRVFLPGASGARLAPGTRARDDHLCGRHRVPCPHHGQGSSGARATHCGLH